MVVVMIVVVLVVVVVAVAVVEAAAAEASAVVVVPVENVRVHVRPYLGPESPKSLGCIIWRKLVLSSRPPATPDLEQGRLKP